MKNSWYSIGQNILHSAKRVNKNTVEVTIKNNSGFYHCAVLYSNELKYGRWDILELAIKYFRERGCGF